jgi:aminopeptidase YwaD
METEELYLKSLAYLRKFCEEIPERCVGSEGNRMATNYFKNEISAIGWETEKQEFDAIDWEDGGAILHSGNSNFDVFVSPYSLGCAVDAPLVSASNITELSRLEINGKVLLLHGEIAKEQLMPKNFVFYNPEQHQQIISLLERGRPEAIICATGRNAALAGGVYPFPLIEDGDFDIPSVYMTEDEGRKLLDYVGKTVVLTSKSKRIPGKGDNIIARKGQPSSERIVITAHIDAKKGTPGAVDNATGVVVLLLLAKLLEDYEGDRLIEIVAFNGEDYYAVPGQMLYITKNRDCFDEILLNINIDGAGYKEGESVFSFYGLPEEMETKANEVLSKFDGITKGVQWAQGDHSIFTQNGRPAIAVSSKWFTENIDSQDITHTPKDSIEIVDCNKMVEIAEALNLFVRK